MRQLLIACGTLALAGLVTALPAGAQPAAPPADTGSERAGGGDAASHETTSRHMTGPGMMDPRMVEMMCSMMHGGRMQGMPAAPGMPAPPGMTNPMMDAMMQRMMGGRGGMGMMGQGMAGAPVDPKVMGRRLQIRGDILKAVGEVLLKHGKAMEEGR